MSDQNVSDARRSGAGVNLLLGLTLLLLLMAMWLALSVETTTFWTANNMANLLRQGAMIAILAIGETFVIITGGIDLSVGAIAGFMSMIGGLAADPRSRLRLLDHRARFPSRSPSASSSACSTPSAWCRWVCRRSS